MVNCGEKRTKCYGRSCLMPKYRSKFEEQVCDKLTQQKIKFKYEPIKIKYVIPETNHTYIPDVILPNGIIIEIKGRLTKQDRFKHLYIQKQKPELDIRKNKFLWHEKTIPLQWINEPRKESKRQNKNIKHLSDSRRSINGKKL